MLASLLYVSPVLAPFVAVIVACKVWERWMEKRTSRVNDLPAQSPADAIGARRRVKDTSPLRPVQ